MDEIANSVLGHPTVAQDLVGAGVEANHTIEDACV